MIWDVPHHRGASLPLAILRPAGLYPVLAALSEHPHLRPIDLLDLLATANARDEPLVGRRDLSTGVGDLLGGLHGQGLVERRDAGGRGAHTRYSLTGLGAGLIGALGPLTSWAMGDFDFVVAATRVRLGMPPLSHPIPGALRTERAATGMAIGVLQLQWSCTAMVYIDSCGRSGISPQALEDAVNADIAASGVPGRPARRLYRDTMYRTLHRLVDKGLLEQHADPPHMFYALSPHGRGLMDAWWQVAEDFGIPHDKELFRIVARTTGWFPDASAD
jgi:DNA-binding HxlR family transcriptional regulator